MNEDKRTQLEAFLSRAGRQRLVVGILNITPDSFSDGGLFDAPEVAIRHARAMAEAGAALIDIGGESTRPGFIPVSAEEEWGRVMPVLAALAEAITPPISIDTTKPAVARAALARGAVIVNDIWGFHGDPALPEVVAEAGAAAIVMHNRLALDGSIDIVADMCRFFETALARAASAGIPDRHLILDPGIGFGKTPPQQLQALAGIGRLAAEFGRPILVGVSRKSFLGRITGAPVGARAIETIAANLAAAAAGATLFRVHDVAEHVTALKIFDAIRAAAPPEAAAGGLP